MSIAQFDLQINNTTVQRLSADSVTGQKSMTISDDPTTLDNPDFSALVNIHSTKAGVSFPSVTDAEMNAIVDPKHGLIVHNTTQGKVFIYTLAYGWFPISGLSLPVLATPNGIATWGEVSSGVGRVVHDTPVTIDNTTGNMVFPANATVDLTNTGTLNATTVKANNLYSRSYYVNSGVSDVQAALTAIGASQANTIYMTAGSYTGTDVLITGKNNLAISGVYIGTAITNTELPDTRGITIDATSARIRLNSLSIKGLLTLGSTGNNYFTNLALAGGITVSSATTGSFFFNDCDISGTITVPSNFGGALVFVNCNFNGSATTFALTNPSALQVQIINCINLSSFTIVNATLNAQNALVTTNALQTKTTTLIATGAAQVNSLTASTVSLTGLTQTQINALTPTNGMEVYNTTVGKFQFYQGSAWVDLNSGGSGGPVITTSVTVNDSSGTQAVFLTSDNVTGGGLAIYNTTGQPTAALTCAGTSNNGLLALRNATTGSTTFSVDGTAGNLSTTGTITTGGAISGGVVNTGALSLSPMTVAQRNDLTATGGTLAFVTDNPSPVGGLPSPALTIYDGTSWRTITMV